MNWKEAEWILEIQRKTKALREAAEVLDDEVRESASFDLDDAKACFEDVKKVLSDLGELLSLEAEELQEEEE